MSLSVQQQPIHIEPNRRPVARSRTFSQGSLSPKVFITNMSEVNEETLFPAIKAVASEEWKEELGNTPTVGAASTDRPATAEQARPNLAFGQHYQYPPQTTPFAPPSAYYPYHRHPAEGPPRYHPVHPFQYAGHPPTRGPPPPVSSGAYAHYYHHQQAPFRRPPNGAVFREQPSSSHPRPRYPAVPASQSMTAYPAPAPPSHRQPPHSGSRRADIFPSFSFPMNGHSEARNMHQLRQTSSNNSDGNSIGEEGFPLSPGGTSQKKRKMLDARQSESLERLGVDTRDGTNTKKDKAAASFIGKQKTSRFISPKPRSSTDIDSKKLILTVSASPTDHVEGGEGSAGSSQQVQNERSIFRSNSCDKEALGPPTVPDSPGQNFLALMDESFDQDDWKINGSSSSNHEHHSSVGSFSLLPLLDAEADQARTSPPMIPFLSKSPQLSWETAEVAEDDQRENSGGNNPEQANGKGQLKRRLSVAMEDTKLNLRPHFEMPVQQPNDVLLNSAQDEPIASYRVINQSTTWQQPSASYSLGRDDYYSLRATSFDGREPPPKMPSSDAAKGQYRPPAIFRSPPPPNRSYPHPPVPVYHAGAMSPPSPHFRFPAGSPGMHGVVSPVRSPVISPRRLESMTKSLRKVAGESKGRCVALGHPLPRKFQGNMELCSDENVPDFSTLVNFPTNCTLRQTGVLPNGTRCCVMCGCVRSTCSRMRSRKNNESGNKIQSPGGESTGAGDYQYDDFVTIPTQNKGLCTLCDISVWVVLESGCQIKWCKGCKNFRPWAGFGDKGLATKCVRCRDRQREKYALAKDAKRK